MPLTGGRALPMAAHPGGSSSALPSSLLASRHTPSAHGNPEEQNPGNLKLPSAPNPALLEGLGQSPQPHLSAPSRAPNGRPATASGRRDTPRCPPAPGAHPGQPQPAGTAQPGPGAGTDREQRQSRPRRAPQRSPAAGVRICPFRRWRPQATVRKRTRTFFP